MLELWNSMKDNAIFLLEFFGMIVAFVLVAYVIEKYVKRKNGVEERILSTKKMTLIGMLSAIAAILMILEVGVPFAPFFYKIDLSELPILIGTFAYGPVAGVLTELVKIILKLLIKGTSTAFVGEMANFVVGCSFILPASILYMMKKTKKTAIIACMVGTMGMTVVGSSLNGIYLLPKFAELYGMPLDQIVAFGTEINSAITDVSTLVLWAVAPLNLLKGIAVSVLTILIYKKMSPILKK